MKVALVQYRVEPRHYASVSTFEASLDPLVMVLHTEQPDLVVFPEHIGTYLAFSGIQTFVGEKAERAALRLLLKRPDLLAKTLFHLARRQTNIARAMGFARIGYLQSELQRIFSGIAQRLRCFVVAGSFPTQDGGQIFNCSWVFDASGQVQGRVSKFNLMDEEKPYFDIAPLEQIRPVPLGGVSLGVTVCADAFLPEVGERLIRQGAQALLCPRANPAPWTPEEEKESRKGVFARLQEQGGWLWGCEVFLVGDILDTHFEGRSRIFVPGQDDPIAQAQTATEEEIVVAEVPS